LHIILNQDFNNNFATFATFLADSTNLNEKVKYIEDARLKYDSYDYKYWKKAYFDEETGGFNVYHIRHEFAKTGGGGEAEIIVGKILAKINNKQVEFLPEGGKKQPDIKFDEQTWDIKYIDKANEQTVRNYIKDAKKADNAIFYFTKEEKYQLLKSATDREAGRFLSRQTNRIPNIYFIDQNGYLKLLWKK